MAATDNMQTAQFSAETYKADRMRVLYERSLKTTPISEVTNAPKK